MHATNSIFIPQKPQPTAGTANTHEAKTNSDETPPGSARVDLAALDLPDGQSRALGSDESERVDEAGGRAERQASERDHIYLFQPRHRTQGWLETRASGSRR